MFRYSDRRSPRGQMIIIVALALTALVAMTGLVIDGGMAWSNRRQVQNAADAAAMAGARVLGIDLKWRAVNGANPSPPPAPFADADAAVCDAINNALSYNENRQQAIAAIDCYTGSDDAWYTDFDRVDLGRVGQGIPPGAQGVKVTPTGQSDTFLMGVIGISTINVGADAVAITGPGEPPLGNLMPFVAQNPLGPWVPGQQYEIRSEDEGECDTAAVPGHLAMDGADHSMVLAMAGPGGAAGAVLLAPGQPAVPVATPAAPFSFTTSVTVTLTAESNGHNIYYTTDGTDPTTSSALYTGPLTFTSSTTLKAIARHGSRSSDIGTFSYTQETPPTPPTANPGDGTTFAAGGSVSVTLSAEAGTTIRYTLDGSTPTSSSTVYGGAITISDSTQIKAIAIRNSTGASSSVAAFSYTEDGDTVPPVADPPSGDEFETTLAVHLTSTTPGVTIWYTVDGSDPTTSSTRSQYNVQVSLVATTTIRAYATVGGNDSAVVDFTYTKTGPVCPELTAGNFGWVDYSGGSNSNADLKNEIVNPEDASTDWYHTTCASSTSTQCRDRHDVADPADDHWRLEGTPGHRNVSLNLVCTNYLNDIIYVPIWDGFETMPTKPNGNNAVFHIIGFAAFRLDGVIDNKNNGDPSNDACGDGIDSGPPNDKGFIGTYVDAFVGTQAAPCLPSEDGTNPCANLSNDSFVVNLAE